MSILKLTVSLLLAAFFTAGPGLAAVGSWNGIGFTAWNGVAVTSWNGTSISTGGGGGSWTDIIADSATNANDATAATVMVWDAITLPAGTATKIRAYIRSYTITSGLRLGLYNSGGTLLDSGTVSVTGTGYFEVTINTAVSATTYYVAKIPEGNSDFGVGYDNSTGSADYATGQTTYTLPGTLPTTEGSFTGSYAFGVFVE